MDREPDISTIGAWGLTLLLAVAVLWTALLPASALGVTRSHGSAAAAGGVVPQYGAYGAYGEVARLGGFDTSGYANGNYTGALTPGTFIDPVGFAVDTHDQTSGGDGTAIYVLDRISNLPAFSGSSTRWRLQKLDDHGHVLGTSEFSLPSAVGPATTGSGSGLGVYEMLGLAVDPNAHTVYSIITGWDYWYTSSASTSSPQTGEEIVGWSTIPNGSHQLVAGSGLPADTLSHGISGYAAPGLLSSETQLGALPSELSGSSPDPALVNPQGLALDVTGGSSFLAVQGNDTTPRSTGDNSGVIQICESATCGTRGTVTRRWSSYVLADPVEQADAPAGISTAPDGSLTLVLQESGPGVQGAANQDDDVVSLPPSLPTNGSGAGAPLSLAGIPNALTFPDNSGFDPDNSAMYTSGVSPESGDPDGATAGSNLPAPQIVALANGLYAAEFEPGFFGFGDSENPSSANYLWTATTPGVRLLDPAAEADHTLSNVVPPLLSLYDTLGNTGLAGSGAGGACSLSDAVAQAAGAGTFPALAAGTQGSVWILTRGQDSSAGNGSGVDFNGGRQLIELAPGQGTPCPQPSGSFSVQVGGAAPQLATTPVTVPQGSSVTFDASTVAYPVSDTGQPQSARSEYEWSFGNGSIQTTQVDTTTYTWPGTRATTSYPNVGTYTATLTIHGDYGVAVQQATINVVPTAHPVAAFSVSPSDPTAGSVISFDASASQPAPQSTIIDYCWSFDTGPCDDTGSFAADAYIFPQPGTYPVTLTVTDADHRTATSTETVTVAPAPSPSPPGPPSSPGASAPAAPPSPGAHARVVGPGRVRIAISPHVRAGGLVSIRLMCAADTAGCAGNVALQTRRAVLVGGSPHRRRAVLALGGRGFALAAGEQRTMLVRLSAPGLAALRRSRRLAITAVVTSHRAAGVRRITTYRVTLDLPWARRPRRRGGR